MLIQHHRARRGPLLIPGSSFVLRGWISACVAALVTTFLLATGVNARPYPGISGIAATADSASTAGDNPAGMVRLDERNWQLEVIGFFSESTWEGQFDDVGFEYTSNNSGSTIVPVGAFVQPINEDFSFGFTVLGFGISDDLGDWPGKYFIQSYDSISVSAYPSLAYRVRGAEHSHLSDRAAPA